MVESKKKQHNLNVKEKLDNLDLVVTENEPNKCSYSVKNNPVFTV